MSTGFTILDGKTYLSYLMGKKQILLAQDMDNDEERSRQGNDTSSEGQQEGRPDHPQKKKRQDGVDADEENENEDRPM